MDWAGWVCNILFHTSVIYLIIIFRSNRSNRKSQMKRHMVETKKLKNRGIKKGALKKDESNVLLLGNDWHRVCAPLKRGKTHSLVFWSKSGPEDKPSWDKLVSCYYFYFAYKKVLT